MLDGIWVPPLAFHTYPILPVPQRLKFAAPEQLRWRWVRTAGLEDDVEALGRIVSTEQR
jgi:hypothetical protein